MLMALAGSKTLPVVAIILAVSANALAADPSFYSAHTTPLPTVPQGTTTTLLEV